MEQQQFDYMVGRLSEQDKLLRDILVQATKTNGRVSSTEKEVNRLVIDVDTLKTSKSRIQGRDKVLGWLMAGGLTGLGALLGYFIDHLISKI